MVDEQEQRIPARLQRGEEVISQAQAGGMSAVGAIRATETCLQCHRSKHAGDVLGAFIYRVLPVQTQLQASL